MLKRTHLRVLAGFLITCGLCTAEDLNGQKHFSEMLFEATFAIESDSCCLGTGFCIGCETTGKKFFVTARHVLDSLAGDTAVIFYRKMLPDGTWKTITYRQAIRRKGVPLYVVHPNPAVDVAAFYMQDSGDSTFARQFQPFSNRLLAKDEDMRKYWIHPGDELFFLGYPAGMTSPEGAFPILRSGFISSYPFLPLNEHVFIFLDGSVFDGNSGGPVFFEYAPSSWGGRFVNQKGFIVGLISFSLTPEVSLKIDPIKKRRDIRVAGFVNSVFILELLASMGCN